MSHFASGQRAADVAEQSLRQAEHIDKHIQTLREMVLDSDILGHSPG
jgi:hypothetical protein